MMKRVYGHDGPAPGAFEHGLRLRFRTAHLPLRWSDCSATANFLSAYYGALFRAELGAAHVSDVTHSVAYLANELLENTVKFRAPGDVELEAGLSGGEFLLRITNQIAGETSEGFEKLLGELTEGDPGELLLARIEANAADESSSGSGLGILTLMNDYGVRFTWIFSPGAGEDGRVVLQTLARLRLPADTA
jgi:hypothetical protein